MARYCINLQRAHSMPLIPFSLNFYFHFALRLTFCAIILHNLLDCQRRSALIDNSDSLPFYLSFVINYCELLGE